MLNKNENKNYVQFYTDYLNRKFKFDLFFYLDVKDMKLRNKKKIKRKLGYLKDKNYEKTLFVLHNLFV